MVKHGYSAIKHLKFKSLFGAFLTWNCRLKHGPSTSFALEKYKTEAETTLSLGVSLRTFTSRPVDSKTSSMAEKDEFNGGSLKDTEQQLEVADASSGEELHTVEKGYTDVLVDLPPEEGKRVLRKVDYRLVPLLAFLYLVAFVDRSNIGNAKIAGLEDDLNLAGLRWNTAVTMFFVSYGLFEVPANIILKLWRYVSCPYFVSWQGYGLTCVARPSRWIALIMYVHLRGSEV